MKDISDDSIETLYTKTITSPEIINTIGNSMSELAVKKFMEKNVNGKEIELEITLNSIEEPDDLIKQYSQCEYLARGSVSTYKNGFGRFISKNSFDISIYSNNDKLISAKIGSKYKVKGKINVKQISSSSMSFLSYEIYEK